MTTMAMTDRDYRVLMKAIAPVIEDRIRAYATLTAQELATPIQDLQTRLERLDGIKAAAVPSYVELPPGANGKRRVRLLNGDQR